MPSRKSIGRKRIKKIWFFVLVFFAPWSFGIEIDIDARCRAVLLNASLSAQRTGNSFPFQRHGSEWTELHKAIRDLEIKPLDAQNPSWDTFRTLLDRRVRLDSELFHDWYKLVGEIVYRDRGLPQKSGEPFANANVSDRLFEWFNKDKAAWNSPQNARAIAKGIGRQNKLILDSVLRSRQEIDRGLEAFRQVVLRQKGLLSALLVQGAGLPSSARVEDFIDWLLYGKAFITNELESHLGTRRIVNPEGYQTGFGPSYTRWVAEMVKELKLTSQDTVVDIGSGLGKVVLLGPHLSPARFIGVEIVPERFAFSEQQRLELNVSNASFVLGDAMAPENRTIFEQATVFYLFNPLSPRDVNRFVDTLAQLPALPGNRNRRIVTTNMHGFPRHPRARFNSIRHEDLLEVFEVVPTRQ